jgi:hypothetical protein
MELLAGPEPDDIQGCPLMFPDTAFFEDGRVVEVIRSEVTKDGEAFIVRDKKDSVNVGIGIQDIRTNFSTIVRERRKDYSVVEAQRLRADSQLTKKDSNDLQSPKTYHSEVGADSSPKGSVVSRKKSPQQQ